MIAGLKDQARLHGHMNSQTSSAHTIESPTVPRDKKSLATVLKSKILLYWVMVLRTAHFSFCSLAKNPRRTALGISRAVFVTLLKNASSSTSNSSASTRKNIVILRVTKIMNANSSPVKNILHSRRDLPLQMRESNQRIFRSVLSLLMIFC